MNHQPISEENNLKLKIKARTAIIAKDPKITLLLIRKYYATGERRLQL